MGTKVWSFWHPKWPFSAWAVTAPDGHPNLGEPRQGVLGGFLGGFEEGWGWVATQNGKTGPYAEIQEPKGALGA